MSITGYTGEHQYRWVHDSWPVLLALCELEGVPHGHGCVVSLHNQKASNLLQTDVEIDPATARHWH